VGAPIGSNPSIVRGNTSNDLALLDDLWRQTLLLLAVPQNVPTLA
jgi:hypothetical protein